MTKFNLLSYLSNRERGGVKVKSGRSSVLGYLEEKGSKPTINQPCKLSGQCRATFLMDFSPDGTKVASTHGDHTVRVSEVATGKCLHILRGHPRTPWCLAFHPSSNQILASGCLGGEVRIWDLHGCGTEVWRSKDSQVITSLTFHPTDHVLVFSVTNHIYFWDWSQPEPFVVCKTKFEFEKIRWVKFDPLGSYLYTGIANNITVRPTSRVSFISSNSSPAPPNPRTQQLGNVYDGLVECFQASRRDRVLNQTEGGQDLQSSSSIQHGASNHPHSPVHEEGLNLARQYASHITESSQRSTYGGPQRTEIPSGASNDSSSPDTDMDVISSPAEPRLLRNPPRAASAENDVSGETTPDVVSTDIEPSQTRPVSNSDSVPGTLIVTERSPEQASPPFQSLDPPTGVRIVSESQAMNESIHSRLGNQVHASTVAFNVAPQEERAEEIVNLSDIASRGLSNNDISQHSSTTDCERDNCPVCGNFNTRHLRRVCESEMFTQLRARRRSLQNSINNASARSAFSRPYFYNRHGSLVRPEVHSIHDPSQLGEMHEIRRVENPNAGASNVDNATSNNNVPSNTEGDARLTQVGDNIDICASIHENFASITARIEREMNELDRRINTLRNTFNESLRRLQHHRVSFLSAREGDVNGRRPTSFLVARHIQQAEGASASRLEDSTHSMERGQHLLETALRSSHQDISSTHTHSAPRDPDSSQNWQSLERHHLHPHYSVSILDNTINRPNDPIQTAINRAIADAFMGRGEPAVAANIINHTYRIQAWDFSKCCIPDLTDTKSNIIVQHCKLHNEASCNLSQDGTMLATFVPSHRGFPDDNILAVYSLETRTRGQCLYTKSFGPNAISVSLSPGCDYVMVGLAAKQLSWVFTPNQLVAQILKLENKHAGEKSMQHVTDVMHPCDMDIRTHVSVNSTRWLPESGEGIVYGTNRGDLHICRPGTKMSIKGDNSDDRSIRRNLMHMLRMSGEQEVSRINSSTQTPGVRRSAATQTDTDDNT